MKKVILLLSLIGVLVFLPSFSIAAPCGNGYVVYSTLSQNCSVAGPACDERFSVNRGWIFRGSDTQYIGTCDNWDNPACCNAICTSIDSNTGKCTLKPEIQSTFDPNEAYPTALHRGGYNNIFAGPPSNPLAQWETNFAKIAIVLVLIAFLFRRFLRARDLRQFFWYPKAVSTLFGVLFMAFIGIGILNVVYPPHSFIEEIAFSLLYAIPIFYFLVGYVFSKSDKREKNKSNFWNEFVLLRRINGRMSVVYVVTLALIGGLLYNIQLIPLLSSYSSFIWPLLGLWAVFLTYELGKELGFEQNLIWPILLVLVPVALVLLPNISWSLTWRYFTQAIGFSFLLTSIFYFGLFRALHKTTSEKITWGWKQRVLFGIIAYLFTMGFLGLVGLWTGSLLL